MDGDLVRRRLIASVDSRTSVVCLEAAGQVVDGDEPFHTLKGDLMSPPFHIHCRSLVIPFIGGDRGTLVRRARAELKRRSARSRRRAARIPGPTA